MLTMFFCEGPVRSFAEAKGSDTAAFASYWRHMLGRGVYLAPSQFEAAMISLALTDDDLELAAAAAHDWFAGAGA
jgi:glutamate-1-semialdehyde 2,1-aminomutase